MERFRDQPLRSRSHIAVFSSSKVGNFVLTTPLLRGLKEKYPDCQLDFFGSDITADFEQHSPYVDFRFSLYSKRPDFLEALTAAVVERRQIAGDYDLAINCDEFSELNLVAVTAIRPRYLAGAGLSPDFQRKFASGDDPVLRMLRDDDWNSLAFVERHQAVIQSNYIAEIFCRLAYVETDFFKLELPSQVPDFPIPDILVHITTTRRAKMWPFGYWQQVIEWCEAVGYSVGVVGSPPATQRTLYHAGSDEDDLIAATHLIDLRGKTSLIELAGALTQTKACVTVDAGPLHIAAAVGCPTIAIFGNAADGEGASPIRLWAPRQSHVWTTITPHRCSLCSENHFKNEACLLDDHPCMNALKPDQVIQQLQHVLSRQ